MSEDASYPSVRSTAKTSCGSVRLELVGWCTLATFVHYLLRNIPSVVLADPKGISAEYGWSNEDSGFINSAFYWGYFLAQPFTGALASRYGGKPVLLVSALGCICCGALVPFVASLGTGATAVRSAART